LRALLIFVSLKNEIMIIVAPFGRSITGIKQADQFPCSPSKEQPLLFAYFDIGTGFFRAAFFLSFAQARTGEAALSINSDI
jgi:hypothetical protein